MTKEELLKKKVSAISLGCDKNRVDLEKILFSLRDYGFEIVAEPEEADIVIVNTCAFILPAKEESINSIIEMESLKDKGVIEKILVTGCFPERNMKELVENFPKIDAFVRVRDNEKLPVTIAGLYGISDEKYKKKSGRVLTTTGSYAFLKIADGCNNACSYCAIPRIRGRYISAPMDELVSEAEKLVKDGVKEIILVAQDTSRYGEDLYGENKLIELCKKLIKIKGLQWLRLHYLYPEKLTDELLEFISNEEKICNYIDIPLQHIDDDILKSMRRRMGEADTRALIEKIKVNFPNLAIRTTFIVGYPGETGKKFKKLCEFIKDAKFDYAGFFPYYREENTASYFMKNQVASYIKKHRLSKAKKVQESVVKQKVQEMLDEEIEVLIDAFDCTTGLYLGHTRKQSPGVDFGVEVDGENLKIGDIVKVKINSFNGSNYGGVKL